LVDIAKVEEVIGKAIEEAESNPELGGTEVVEFAVAVVKQELDIACTYSYIGGFDSPGYRIDCYAIAYFTESQDIGIYPYNYELY